MHRHGRSSGCAYRFQHRLERLGAADGISQGTHRGRCLRIGTQKDDRNAVTEQLQSCHPSDGMMLAEDDDHVHWLTAVCSKFLEAVSDVQSKPCAVQRFQDRSAGYAIVAYKKDPVVGHDTSIYQVWECPDSITSARHRDVTLITSHRFL